MARGAKIVDKTADFDEKSSRPSKADPLNRAIVNCLEQDGRMSFSDIAKELKVSEGTIRNRYRNMKKAGMLQVVALTDPVAAEYKSDAMLGLKVASGCSVETVSERLGKSAEVVYILWVSGRFDLLVEIVSNDRDGFLDFLNREIYGQLDIAATETMVGLKNLKNQFLLKRDWK